MSLPYVSLATALDTHCALDMIIGPSATAAVPALRDCLNDPEEQVRRAAAVAIERIEHIQRR